MSAHSSLNSRTMKLTHGICEDALSCIEISNIHGLNGVRWKSKKRLSDAGTASIANTHSLKRNGVKKDIYMEMRRIGSALTVNARKVGEV